VFQVTTIKRSDLECNLGMLNSAMEIHGEGKDRYSLSYCPDFKFRPFKATLRRSDGGLVSFGDFRFMLFYLSDMLAAVETWASGKHDSTLAAFVERRVWALCTLDDDDDPYYGDDDDRKEVTPLPTGRAYDLAYGDDD
jgi:hypothetical protein